MEPATPVGKNFTYHAPPGMEGEVGSLDVRRENTDQGVAVVSAWKPSADELAILTAGGHVELAVWMMPPPPVSVIARFPACPECGEEMDWDEQTGQFVHRHVESDTDEGGELGA